MKRTRPTKKNPVITPTQERARETFQAVLKATTYIIEREGPHALTSNHIAEKAGINIASFYQYFLDKDAVIAEILLRLMADDQERFRKAIGAAATRPQKEAFRAIVQAGIDLYSDRPKLRRHLFPMVTHYLGRDRTFENRARFSAAILSFFPKETVEREPESAQLAARVLVHTFLGVCNSMADLDPEFHRREELRREIVAICVRYFEGWCAEHDTGDKK